MFNILTLNKISPVGLNKLPQENYAISDSVENPDGIILRSFSLHEMEFPQSLLAIARAGAGTNNIPVAKCAEAGIVVFNSPGANANAVKELVIASLIFSSRNVIGGIEWSKTLKGQADADKQVEKGKSAFIGPEIMGKTLGVIGLGNVGGKVCDAAADLGMHVIGFDPYKTADLACAQFTKDFSYAANLEELYKESDYITVHVPFTPETKFMFNKDTFALMKKGVRLVNFSRAELVNNEDLKAAVADGTIAYYVTDFPNIEVLDIDQVIALPHIGASTPESEENCAAMAAMEIKDYLENGNITNSVNYANCSLAVSANSGRIGVHYKANAAMVTGITAALAANGINVTAVASSTKGEFSYSLLETTALAGKAEAAVAAISAIADVIRVRVIKEA